MHWNQSEAVSSEPPPPRNSSNSRVDVHTSGLELSFSPENLFGSPDRRRTLDPITDLFQTLRIAGVVHARLEATAPWD